jgi:hypothetical protein
VPKYCYTSATSWSRQRDERVPRRAAFLGGVIGFERDIHRRQAGLRTHLIVAMASATFMVVSAHFVFFQRYVPGNLVAVDSSRIAASVVAGVGFLGGGSILRTGATVQGLTTAAGLWLVAAIGLCAGSGMYPESVFVTVLGLLALTVLRVFEDKKVLRRRVVLTFQVYADGMDWGWSRPITAGGAGRPAFDGGNPVSAGGELPGSPLLHAEQKANVNVSPVPCHSFMLARSA